jgi:hypothetical protein
MVPVPDVPCTTPVPIQVECAAVLHVVPGHEVVARPIGESDAILRTVADRITRLVYTVDVLQIHAVVVPSHGITTDHPF